MADRRLMWALGAAGAVTAMAMIATPLFPTGGSGRRRLSSIVVTGLFTTTVLRAGERWGAGRALAAAGSIAATTAAVERVGVATGLPFGRYHYTAALRPQIAGVPVIVPLAWFAMAVPAREVAGHRGPMWRRIVVGSAALTAWDAFLDPQMVTEGYWRWERRGLYRSIPLGNFVGWFVTGLGVMAVLEVLLPVERADTSERVDTSARTDADDQTDEVSPSGDPIFVGQYSFMAVMETIGFAAFFRDRVVAAVGGAAMLPFAAIAIGRALGRRPGRSR